ncbi:VOC family protein [Amycolatopsis sp. NPDC051903]|uniref:VOC family protein n=1 Tax=Amycolatopsis sp. NPDC051903 TaxID=3363936 RepID=UPI0037B682DA
MTPVWFDVSTPDAARARRFYGELFGWPVTAIDGTYALIGEPAAPSGGIGQAGPDSPYVGLVVYFDVPSLEEALDKAEELGGKRTLDPVGLPDGNRMAVFTDPDGNPVGLRQLA